ncbi:co-chaperone GroES, partial [Lacticaseibacillus rhamnosus]
AKQNPQAGKVVDVGEGDLTPEGKRLPMAVKVGDTVLDDKYAGSEVK